ncbi:MAG TPA: radical SAM family heme chaperone HemW [Terriglobales bacterium]|nr:radical SAM family heme chaperone HemW [Terriglobales bacterium]
MRAGLYVHFPFCRAKCPYCHFYSVEPRGGLVAQWWEGLKREAERHVKTNVSVETVYVGGGTPSLLPPEDVRALRELLDARFWLKTREFTLEANPEVEDKSFLGGWREAGVTRLSVGVQSFDDAVLAVLGRGYWAAAAADFCGLARAAGFESLGLDLMIGVPGETREGAKRTLDEAVRLAPDHVSLYVLENVEGLPFEKLLARHPVDDDAVADVYAMFQARLAAAGLRQYEISNFARPGKECLHNLKYWRYEPFLGLGPSASSHLGNKRWSNVRELAAWAEALRRGRPPVAETVELTAEASAREALVFGLRLVEGVDLEALGASFGLDLEALFARELAELEGEGWLVREGSTVRIPPGRFLVSNHVFSKLV